VWESKGEGSVCERNGRDIADGTAVSQETPEIVEISEPLIKSFHKVSNKVTTNSVSDAFAFF